MTLYVAEGSPSTVLRAADLRRLLEGSLDTIGPRRRVLAVPPPTSPVSTAAPAF